ncbi:hypothetical protein GQ44DRAFT_778524 [Phaeosphaeriaceae sp. PMI808]|nr:hypothetical protein GQ44DRAFT_778524 [Phaeosphaeriaceae sp. PMI808]
MDSETTVQVQLQIVEAVTSGDVEGFKRLIERCPDWPDNDYVLGYPHDMSVDSFEMFKAFVERFPQTKDWHCGHMGNPVGLAAVKGDIPFLKYLIEELGHKANEGRFLYIPVV